MRLDNMRYNPFTLRNRQILEKFVAEGGKEYDKKGNIRTVKITTKLFDDDRIQKYEEKFQKDLCEFNSKELKQAFEGWSFRYKKTTMMNWISLVRRYKYFMKQLVDSKVPLLRGGQPVEKVKVITDKEDDFSEDTILKDCSYQTFHVFDYKYIDQVTGLLYKTHPIECMIWNLTFHFGATLSELRNMKLEQVSLKIYENTDFVTKTMNDFDITELKQLDDSNILSATWTTCEDRVIDLLEPKKVTKEYNLERAFDNIPRILIFAATYQENGIGKTGGRYFSNAKASGGYFVRSAERGVATAMTEPVNEARIPTLLTVFSTDEDILAQEEAFAHGDIIYSHLLFKICSLGVTIPKILEDPIYQKVKVKTDKDTLMSLVEYFGY